MALNVIHLAGEVTRDVRVNSSDSVLLPGELVEVKNDGKVKRQATASADAPVLLVDVNTAFNKGPDDSYATGDQVHVMYLHPGAKAYVWLPSGGTAVSIGDFLETSTAGKFRKYTSGVKLMVVEEAADPTSADVKVKATKI